MKAAILTNITAPYRTELFRYVQPRLESMVVYFQSDSEPFRTWEARPDLPFRHAYLATTGIRVGRRRIGLYSELGRMLQHENPTVVVAYGFSVGALRCVLHCRATKRPLVIANDGTMETDPCRGIEYRYRRWLVSQATWFIAASESAAEYFRHLGVSPEQITVVELTTDLLAVKSGVSRLRSVRMRDWGQAEWDPLVVMASRLVPDKRVLEGCEAVVRASRHLPRIGLAIAGEGPERDRIEEWIRSNGEGRVRLLGLLKWEDMLSLYGATGALLFPATRERFGMVVIEALAAGVPVIAYAKSGAARDLIHNGVNGYTIDEGDIDGMSRRLVEMFTNRGHAEMMRRNASAVVEAHDVRIEADRFAAALESACGVAAVSENAGTRLRQESA